MDRESPRSEKEIQRLRELQRRQANTNGANAVGKSPAESNRDMDMLHSMPDCGLKRFLMYECVENINMDGFIDFFRQNPGATLRDAELSVRQHSRREHIRKYIGWSGGDWPGRK